MPRAGLPRTPLGLADALRLAAALGSPSDEQWARIERVTGVTRVVNNSAGRETSVRPAAAGLGAADRGHEPSSGPSPLVPPDDKKPGRLSQAFLTPVAHEAPWSPAWRSFTSPAAETLPPSTGTELQVRPRRIGLLEERWFRELMRAALGSHAARGAPNWNALIRKVVRGELVRELPRARRLAIRAMVHLLLDEGSAFSLFYADQAEFEVMLERVVGAHRLRVFRFQGDPREGIEVSRSGERIARYRPEPRCVFIVNSDLGLGPGSRQADIACAAWLQIGRSAPPSCRSVALVPFSDPTKLERIGRVFGLVVRWDRSTSPSQVRRLRGGR